jgi:hypothetical protein
MLRSLILFLILITSISSTLAQGDFRPGFIIKAEHDTIVGEVEFRSRGKNYEACKFRKDGNTTEYNAQQVIGYGFNGDKYYASGIIEGDFVEQLVDGAISLYRHNDIFFLKKMNTIHKLETNETVTIINGTRGIKKDTRWKGVILFLMNDCRPDESRMEALDLDERKLTKLVSSYNQCTGSTGTVYKQTKPWTKLSVGILLGGTRSDINVKKNGYPYLAERYTSIDPSVGLMLNMFIPKLTEKIGFQAELNFSRTDYSAIVILNNPTNIATYNTSISLTTLSVPVSIKYLFPLKRYTIEMLAGLNYDHHLRSDSKSKNKFDSNGDITTHEMEAFAIKQSQVGYGGGIGINKSFKAFRAGAIFKYYRMGELNKPETLHANMDKLMLSLMFSRGK